MPVAALAPLFVVAAPFAAGGKDRELTTMSVAEVRGRLVALDRRLVRVRGWLGCGAWACGLRARPGRPRAPSGAVPSLGLSASVSAERRLVSAAGQEVEIDAYVDTTCRSGKVICIDNGPDLRVVALHRISGRLVPEAERS